MNRNLHTIFKKPLTRDQILAYFKQFPSWVAGFTAGEGSFTGSYMVKENYTWGISPQCEFNITQLYKDNQELLEAIKLFFHNSGGVYNRVGGVAGYSVRDREQLQKFIIPFFLEHPLIGAKSDEFEKWREIVEILSTSQHLGRSLETRDVHLDILARLRELNKRDTRNAAKKMARNLFITDWLSSLDSAPTLQMKRDFVRQIKKLSSRRDLRQEEIS